MDIHIKLTIDDRFVNFFKNLFRKKNAVKWLMVFLVLCTISLSGSEITKSYHFVENTEINPDEVNENFDDLFSESNAQDTRITALESKSWDKSGNDLVYTGGNIKIGSGYSLKDGNGTTLNGYITTGVSGFPSNSAIKLKIIEIGNWNMDALTNVAIYHGLAYSKVINFWAIIRNDTDNNKYVIIASYPKALAHKTSIVCGTSNVALNRETGGIFDNAGFDSTSYNRGWIFIQYI